MTRVSNAVFRNRIEERFEELDLDVVCRKRKSGYALYWDDDNEPLAKLRPAGVDDRVEVYSWQDGRWQRVESLPGLTPLDDALAYITEDPDELFFDAGDEDDEAQEGGVAGLFAAGAHCYCHQALLCAIIGGAIGGVFASPFAGAAAAVAATVLAAGLGPLLRFQARTALIKAILCGTPAAVLAAAAGALAASAHAQLGDGIGWLICTTVLGAFCTLFMLLGAVITWPFGLVAGVVVGLQLVDALALTADIPRFTLVAIIGSLSAAACTRIVRWLKSIYSAVMSDEDEG